MITIDGTPFTTPHKTISRKFDQLYKYAERTEDGILHSELIGGFANYEMEFGQSLNDLADYAALYLKITEPTESHTVLIPNENGGAAFDAYFANVRDELVKIVGTTNYFRNLSCSVIAIAPSRTPA